MKITIQRSGGFAGTSETVADIDTAALPPSKARALEQAVGASRFFELPSQLASEVGADLMACTITVRDRSRAHTVTVQGAGPPALQSLLALCVESG